MSTAANPTWYCDWVAKERVFVVGIRVYGEDGVDYEIRKITSTRELESFVKAGAGKFFPKSEGEDKHLEEMWNHGGESNGR